MNSASPFTAHQDVLEAAIPADSIGKTILINELKNRAKAAVLAQQWPHASALYRKAVEIVEAQQSSSSAGGSGESNTQEDNSNSTIANDLAILESNLSLVHGKMHQWDAALAAASRAVQVDAKYVKGWWRLGQAQAALENYDLAVKALQEGKKRDPSNKALIKELDKLKVQAADAAAKRAQEAASAAQDTAPSRSGSSSSPATSAPKVTSNITSTKTTTTTTTTTTPTSTKSTTTSISSDTEKMQIDDDGFSKSEVFKGYKIVNGKKTSYFHNELSKEAAELIGDIAPKKLEVTTTAATSSSAAVLAAPGASAWNQAGTWEERDVTSWAQDSLQNKLLAATYTLPEYSPAPSATVRVTKATATGHASVAVARGKKRYIYEWLVKLDWEFQHGDKIAKGHMAFPDVDGTCMVGEPYEAHDFAVTEVDDEHLRPILKDFVHKQGLRDELHKAIDEWVGLFKESY